MAITENICGLAYSMSHLRLRPRLKIKSYFPPCLHVMFYFVFVLLFRLNSDYVKYYIIWFNMLWFGEKFEFKYYIKE